MSDSYDKPEPDGDCALCREPITPDWDTSGTIPARWFCSAGCAKESWLDYAEVPCAYWSFDPSIPRCGPECIRIAEEWIRSHIKREGDRTGLLLHSVLSGTGKTRVATHVAMLHLLPRWRGPEYEAFSLAHGWNPAGVWLNARRFRQKYQQTMHFSKAAEREAWVDHLCRCRLLVLDEPDKLKPSEGLLEILYGILDERFSNGKLTILTTNAGGEELQRRWGPEYGPYLVRRIREFCLAINFD